MKLRDAHKLVMGASCPEDVFGEPYTLEATQKVYRNLAKVLHPDRYPKKPDQRLATEGFAKLLSWHQLATKKATEGVYGDRTAIAKPIVVVTKKNAYTITKRGTPGDFFDTYLAAVKSSPFVLKVPRHPINNDLMRAEVDILKVLADGKSKLVEQHVRMPVESFELQQAGGVRKRVNVFAPLTGYVTLQQVMDAYPKGIHVLDAAWMFNRLMGALLGAHREGVIHGNVTPATFYICPGEPDVHNGVLTDWTRAVRVGGTIKSMNTTYAAYYPPEVTAKRPATTGTDIYMAAKCMLSLIGGDAASGACPPGTHPSLRGLLRACCLHGQHRISDALEVHEDFAKLTGPRRFRKFVMPTPGVA